jgi:alcohol dehydrogenase (cytochrome c)
MLARRTITACVLLLFATVLQGCGDQGTAHQRGASMVGADSALAAAMADSAQWPVNGRDYTNRRFAPLSQIDTGNVARLRPVWQYHTGVSLSFEATPLVIGRVMYLSTPLDHVVALDAPTGRKLWEYIHPLGTTDHCCGPVNRGVAVYDGKVYIGTLDAQLVALDARTGRRVWVRQVGDNDIGYSITAAPVAARGLVITGISGGEYGARGYVSAYDAESGHLVWRFYTIPSPAEGGWWGDWRATEPFGDSLHRDLARERRDSARYADAWKHGGAPVWNTPAVDLRRNLVIFATGNASPDVDGSVRPGDNLYANSIVAVDLRTGRLRWHLQEVPHDVWDLDAASPVVLLDVPDGRGGVRPAAAQAGKSGWVYIVDRETGAPIRRSEEFSPHRFMFTPPTALGSRMTSAAFGGSEWSPPAFSPATGRLYVLGTDMPLIYKVRHEERVPGAWWVGGAYYASRPKNPGNFTAVNVGSGRVEWQQHFPKQMIGGALTTAGGLVFTGTAGKELIAYNARSGEPLWRYQASAGVNAPPMSYMVDGRQYVAVAAGGNWLFDTPRGDAVLAFALDPAAPYTGATQ